MTQRSMGSGAMGGAAVASRGAATGVLTMRGAWWRVPGVLLLLFLFLCARSAEERKRDGGLVRKSEGGEAKAKMWRLSCCMVYCIFYSVAKERIWKD